MKYARQTLIIFKMLISCEVYILPISVRYLMTASRQLHAFEIIGRFPKQP
jgi:hypothetical protein